MKYTKLKVAIQEYMDSVKENWKEAMGKWHPVHICSNRLQESTPVQVLKKKSRKSCFIERFTREINLRNPISLKKISDLNAEVLSYLFLKPLTEMS